MKKTIAAFALALASAMLSSPLLAQGGDSKPLDRFNVKFGAFSLRDANTEIRLDSSTGVLGTNIDFERDLDIDDRDQTLAVEGYYRFSDRHRVSFAYVDLERDGTRVLANDISFGDQTFTAGTPVNSFYDTEILRLTYLYSFFNDDRLELAVGGGLHVSDIDLGISTPGGAIEESESGTAPLPVISALLESTLTPKLALKLNWNFFFIGDSADDYDGSLTDFQALLEHRTFKHVGFGGGYTRFALDIESEDDDLRGSFETLWNGWLLYTFVAY